ncbi:hypothetical protein [uncultured Methanobrevibacter sp.]|uniref:hypothetical protein n=1 Tax=uncultured Methanobrevibacter sp. TaxID=253161 RepID=UPI002609D166
MEESDEDEKGMVYHFFIKEDINPVEFSELSLKINIDLNHFCKMRNLNVFLKTLINIVRE